MIFERFSLFWTGVLSLALFFFYLYLFKKSRKKVESMRGEVLFERKGEEVLLRQFFLLLFLLSLFISTLLPQWGEQTVEIKVGGKDVVFLLDLSRSMLAEDFGESRLERGKEYVKIISSKLEGSRFGLIGFAEEARIFCPLTPDRSSFLSLLDFLDPELLPQGSSLSSAFDLLERALKPATKRGKLVVIITDGEFHEKKWINKAAAFSSKGVMFYIIGVGKGTGSLIPLPDGSIKRDEKGNPVITKLRLNNLKLLAQKTRGKLFIAREISPLKVASFIKNESDRLLLSRFISVKKPRYYIFLLIAAFSLAFTLGLEKKG